MASTNFELDLCDDSKGKLSPDAEAHQREDQIVEQLYQGKNVFLSGPGGCLAPGTLVMMADGTFIEAQNIKVGDLLMGDDSTPRKVLSLASGTDQMFEILPDIGEPFSCNSTHIMTLMRPEPYITYIKVLASWELVSYDSKGYKERETFDSGEKAIHALKLLDKDMSIDISLSDYIALPENIQKNILLYRVPVNFQKVDVPLDPYMIGYWIGNNNQDSACIISADQEVIEYFNSCLTSLSMKCTNYKGHHYCIDMIENVMKDHVNTGNKFFDSLENLNLICNKHIPDIYLRNERKVQLKLLAGLIDSNGLVYKGSNIEIFQKSKHLIDGIVYLCRSLGYTVICKEKSYIKSDKEPVSSKYYLCHIYGNTVGEIPTLIARNKLNPCLMDTRSNVSKFKIIPKGIGSYNGFILDGNQRHLLGDFTVTHNTGKSFALRNIYLKLKDKGITVYKTGSTGVAAESIGGMTLHSWAGVMLGDKDANTYFLTIQGRNRKAWLRWKKTSVLIVDEVSMTGGKFFQMLHDLAKLIRGINTPFGGLTLLICGDLCQLPPVKDIYFFQTDAYHQMNFKTVRLTHPWRFQKDIDFFFMLSRIRIGSHTSEDIQKLEKRKIAYYKEVYNKNYQPGEIKPTRMFSKKIDVADMNNKELDILPGEEYQYVCNDTLQKKNKTSTALIGNFQDLMNKNIPTEISLKKGAQVMLTCNMDIEIGLCNGSRGVVLECLDDCVLVLFKNGVEQFINPNVWTIETEDEIFFRSQIPLILAWSITIHKAQSATLDCVVVDLGTSIFSDNMAYVALSRCRSLEGIYLINLIPEKIRCDPIALEFEKELEKNCN